MLVKKYRILIRKKYSERYIFVKKTIMKKSNIFCLVALLMAAGAASAQTKPLKNAVPANANLATDGKSQQASSSQSSNATVKQNNNNVDVAAKSAPSSKSTQNTSVSNTAAESKSKNNQAATSKMQNVGPKSGVLNSKKQAAKTPQASSTDK